MTQASGTTMGICVLCHNEERRIVACLESILAEDADAPIHVVVNGSSDRTAERARSIRDGRIVVHEFQQGGKSRSWNRFMFETLDQFPDVLVVVDGDAEVALGSLNALAEALATDAHANLASAPPLNGRGAESYRQQMRQQHGVFGDLYAAKGAFLARMKARSIRLPDDLVGDDGLIAAMAKTDLEDERNWDDTRVVVCEQAGFLCEPVRLARWRSVRMQYRRMVNYSVRHFQNAIISEIMKRTGPGGLPRHFAEVYPAYPHLLHPRTGAVLRFFDRRALARIAKASSAK
jgi:glycosyltransferase involved in cell wall biosynthesis